MVGVPYDTDAAVRFLEGRPGFPVLTAIRVDPDTKKKGLIETKSFPQPLDKKALWAWIETRQGKSNIYYLLNPLRAPLDKKCERTDLAAVVSLHVDLDPRAGEDQDEAVKRIISQLAAYAVPPSTIVASGGGVQAIWDLDEADRLPIDGDLGKAEEAKLYNIQLERELGGDACHNVDRILRVPGTVNIAHDLKLKKGRRDARAYVVKQTGKNYPLRTFTKAVQVQESTKATTATSIKVNVDATKLDQVDIDSLPNMKGWVRQHIILGNDPDGHKVYASRSEGVFAVACECVRAGYTDDVIASLLTNPDHAVSAAIREKKNPQRELERVIGRAREFAIDPDLAKLNGKYAVIMNLGGKCRIIAEYFDQAMQCMMFSIMTFEDFRNAYGNVYKEVEIKDGDGGVEIKRVALGTWWLSNPARRQYERVAFVPNGEIDGTYNLWSGFGVDSRPGACSLYLEHVRENICCGEESLYQYVISWMARSVQQPASAGEVALALQGKEGTGKGIMARWWFRLFGRHGRHITNSEHLTGKFNSHLRDCVALFADEAFFAGDRRHESILKTLITEPTLMIEQKGVDALQMANYIHLIMASNNDWIVPASSEARRFCVLHVSDSKMQNGDYFSGIEKQMRAGGVEALLNFLLRLDISNYDVRKVPRTDALLNQQAHTLNVDDAWWESKLQAGEVFAGLPWGSPVIAQQLIEDYYDETQRTRTRAKSSVALTRFLTTRCFPETVKSCLVPQTITERVGKRSIERRANMPAWRLPPLEECRAHWSKLRPGMDWRQPQAEEAVNVDIPF